MPYKQTIEIETSQELIDRIKQVGMFKFKITSLLTLHNYICTAREKKDVHNLLIFDISESKPISQRDKRTGKIIKTDPSSVFKLYRI